MISSSPIVGKEDSKKEKSPKSEEYLGSWMRSSDEFETRFARLQELALTGKSEITPMRTQKTFPDFEQILFKGAQLFRPPLNEDESVILKTVIGKSANHPLEIDIPFYTSPSLH